MSRLLELSGVSKAFTVPSGDILEILRDLDFTAESGEVVAIVGRSGSGKSTFLNILGLLDQPTTGRYVCNGLLASTMSDRERSRLRGEFLGFIFQQFHLLDRRTALENVAEPLLISSRASIARRTEMAAELLEQVGLSARAHSMPHLLSGGEQQRVAIARALIRKPRVILADEPTGSLDEATGRQILELLLQLVRAEGTSLILVSHDPAIARRADRLLALTGGRLETRLR